MQNALELERIKREKFYLDIDDDMKVKFINGEIVVHSPVKIEHAHTGKLLLKLMDTYVPIHGLGWTGFEKVMTSFSRND